MASKQPGQSKGPRQPRRKTPETEAARNLRLIHEAGAEQLALEGATLERVMCDPLAAMAFCENVRLLGGGLKATDFEILSALLNHRKQGNLRSGRRRGRGQ